MIRGDQRLAQIVQPMLGAITSKFLDECRRPAPPSGGHVPVLSRPVAKNGWTRWWWSRQGAERSTHYLARDNRTSESSCQPRACALPDAKRRRAAFVVATSDGLDARAPAKPGYI